MLIPNRFWGKIFLCTETAFLYPKLRLFSVVGFEMYQTQEFFRAIVPFLKPRLHCWSHSFLSANQYFFLTFRWNHYSFFLKQILLKETEKNSHFRKKTRFHLNAKRQWYKYINKQLQARPRLCRFQVGM